MKKKPKDVILKALIQKQTVLKNRIASIEAKIRHEEDKKLTRMKILAGAYLLNQYKDKKNALGKMMDGFLTRDNDRILFGLTPLKNENS